MRYLDRVRSGRRGRRGLGGAVISLLAPDSTFVTAGDSKIDQGSSPGVRNFGQLAVDRLAGRLRFGPGGSQGKSGNTVAQLQARVANVIAQQADITVVAIGHNSMGDADLTTQLQTLHTMLRSGLGTKYIVWTTVTPSATSSGGLYPVGNPTLITVNDFIMSLHGTDGGKTLAVNFGYKSSHVPCFDPLTMCYPEGSSPTQYIHPNKVGGDFNADRLVPVLDALLAAQTVETALDDVGATTTHGANIDSDSKHRMVGTTGTKAGTVTPTGNVATNYTLTNNTTAAVAASKQDMGTYERQIIDTTGTVSAEGTVTFAHTNGAGGRLAINGVGGDYFEGLAGYQITATDGVSPPVGLMYPSLLFGSSLAAFSLSNYTTTDANLGGNVSEGIGPNVARSYPRSIQPQSFVAGVSNVVMTMGLRLAAGQVDVRLVTWKWIGRKTEKTAYAAPFYLGNDTIKGSAEQIGVTGTVANAQVLTFRPGSWSGGGGGAMFKTLRLYQGTASNTGNGTGTLLATVDVSTGVWTWTASGLTSGQKLYPEIDANNGIGGTVTVRGAAISIP